MPLCLFRLERCVNYSDLLTLRSELPASRGNASTWTYVQALVLLPKGCFDNINHEYLLKTIVRFPARKLIHLWLKAAYVDKGVFHETEAGTPQGGIFSPLLANIVLHGMEKYLGVKYIATAKAVRAQSAIHSRSHLLGNQTDLGVCESGF